ncbi:MAG: nicotinate-nucleotide adenylyltransferase [Aquabacterium sp.]
MFSSPSAAPRRIGIMGGSFDPIHVAHVALGETAMKHLQLDEVRWVPVGVPWQKARQLAPAIDRVEMVRLATRHEPCFVVDTIEVDRGGPSYTIETFRTLRAREPAGTEWFLIIGQDQYANLPTWQGWEDLLQGLTLAVARRGHERPNPPPAMQGLAYRVAELPLPALEISSSQVRQRLAEGAGPESLTPGMVAPAVARYIADHQLYAPGHPPLNGHP